MRREIRDLEVTRWILPALVIVVAFGLTIFVGFGYGAGKPDPANPLVIGSIALLLMFLIYKKPYWGLALIIATLPIIDTLPKLPLVTSLFPIIGAATLIAFIFERNRRGLTVLPQKLHLTYAFGMLFVLWIFLANPEAALRSGRGVALLTYFQLLVLVWMGGELMDTMAHNRNTMWLYVASCLISAWVAIQDASLGATFDTEGKSGLGGISSSARQFVSAFIILFFLRSVIKKNTMKWLVVVTWVGQVLLLYGVTVTGSRTGILILVIGLVVILLSPTSQIKPQRIIIPAVIGFTIYTAIPSSFWDSMWNSIFPSIQEGSDTVGIRYELWNTAMRMVQDKPITGVGINQFIPNVLKYSDPLSSTVVVVGAHSIYFTVVAETGVIGFVLYMGMVIGALFYAFRTAWTIKDRDYAFLAHTWFTVLIVILVGGITKQDQYDKLLWFVLGACTGMEWIRSRASKQKEQPTFIIERTNGRINANAS